MAYERVSDVDFGRLTARRRYHPSPTDWRDVFLYFLLVDRFNAYPTPQSGPRTPEAGRVFQGGNIAGVTRRLDYIRGLGCSALWISPVFKNRIGDPYSYHGYGIQNFLEIDPRFGTLEDLQTLVSEAHERDMYVVLDVIFNHTGDTWCYPDCHRYYWSAGRRFPFGGWRARDGSVYREGGDFLESGVFPRELREESNFKRRGEITSWSDPRQAVDGDFFSLKELDLNNRRVLSALIDVYKYWIAATDVDGFRVDTVKHMEYDAVAIFANAIHEFCHTIGKHNFFIYGEVVDDESVLRRYVGRNATLPGTDERFPSLDACLDFPLYFVLEEIIKGRGHPVRLSELYGSRKSDSTSFGDIARYFVTFVDNHDQMARPYRRFAADAVSPRQSVNAVAFLLTSLGVPCIYYGTEQGLDGQGDDDSCVREAMFPAPWGAFGTTDRAYFDEDHPIYEGIRRVAAIRRDEPALRYGRLYFREISGNGTDFGQPLDASCTLAYSRILDDTEILVAINLTGVPRADAVTLDANLSRPGGRMIDLLTEKFHGIESRDGRAFVRLALSPFQLAILRLAP